ncbi:MAG TPA: CinA family protein [Anaerolineales bacterium]|nr:CinA family protein [Anaerolineales bacterium]
MTPVSLVKVVSKLLIKQGLTLSTAEASTGGLIGHMLTNIDGSSAFYIGGIVPYSNIIKEQILNVSHETLVSHGAVSEQTAMEMAEGVRVLFGSDIGIAETGIAGAYGEVSDKPIGLFYIAISIKEEIRKKRFLFNSDREGNKLSATKSALEMLEKYLRERDKVY